MALESLRNGLLPCALRTSFNHRILRRWKSLRSMETEASFRIPMRPRSHMPAVPGPLHLNGQLIHHQHTCLSDELGGRPLNGTADPARQSVLRCRGGSMELSLMSHGMVWEKWLLEQLVVSVLSGGLNQTITKRRRTATALARAAPRRPAQHLELA